MTTALLSGCSNIPIEFNSDAGTANASGGAPAVGGTNAIAGSSNPVGSQVTGGATAITSPPLTGSCTSTKLVAAAISAGWYHTCAVLNNGTVQCWGDNGKGALGNGTTTDSTVPVPVLGITNAARAGLGDGRTCALLDSGPVQCWGDNSKGALGNGTTTDSTVPIAVSGITNAVDLGVGDEHVCAPLFYRARPIIGATIPGAHSAMATRPTVPCPLPSLVSPPRPMLPRPTRIPAPRSPAVRFNAGAQILRRELGDGTTTGSAVPVTVAGITSPVLVRAAGDEHTCALVQPGLVRCWGENSEGELGNGTTTNSAVPVAVASITMSTAVATGWFHTCAVLGDWTVQCFGENYYGQLGNGTTTESVLPVTVVGITNAFAVTADASHTCAMLSTGCGSMLGRQRPRPTR